jgi:hypothetical protein
VISRIDILPQSSAETPSVLGSLSQANAGEPAAHTR